MTTFGRYQITGTLGQGAMGVVYRAYDPAPLDGSNRFAQNRKITRVSYRFDDGSSVEHSFVAERRLQFMSIPSVRTSEVRIEILATRPGDPNYDNTAISEIEVYGYQ